jgi:hypothetical protein
MRAIEPSPACTDRGGLLITISLEEQRFDETVEAAEAGARALPSDLGRPDERAGVRRVRRLAAARAVLDYLAND